MSSRPATAPLRFAAALCALALPAALWAQSPPPAAASSNAGPTDLTYADVADLAAAAPLVARVAVRDVVVLKPERAGSVRPGYARLYVTARTRALLAGEGLGESLSYLADVPLDPKGRVPKLKKREVLVFARPVPGRPGELALVAPDAQLLWSPELEQRARAVLTELVGPDAAPRITGVREAMHVRGSLVGEGESQIFLATERGDTVSLTVLRRPGAEPAWGVALGEIVDQAARPPQPDTLTWYRLACFLPAALPPATVLSGSDADRRQAAEDYRYVRAQLGPCPRTRPAEWRR